mmetsp:Transcript_12758/g.18765  ORF Transcript_12758/g.18765 Transcript_12758/m.18765 type:complete len:169 (-) Transcript_12758:1808-2314(-)
MWRKSAIALINLREQLTWCCFKPNNNAENSDDAFDLGIDSDSDSSKSTGEDVREVVLSYEGSVEAGNGDVRLFTIDRHRDKYLEGYPFPILSVEEDDEEIGDKDRQHFLDGRLDLENGVDLKDSYGIDDQKPASNSIEDNKKYYSDEEFEEEISSLDSLTAELSCLEN